MNYLNILKTVACFSFILVFGLVGVQAQFVSDSQILRNYQSEYQSILNDIKNLDSIEDAEELAQRINDFNNEFAEHRELINRAIFPEDFDGQLFSLREIASATRRNLQIIADRDEEITQLNLQISDLTVRLNRFAAQSDSLQQALDRMTRDRNANAAMVRNLRNQINQYDEFILSVVDSIFVAYDNLDLRSLSPSERREFTLRADRDNVVGHVRSVIENNIAFIDTHSQLSSVDLLQLKATHTEFSQVWQNLGGKLAEIYENQRERAAKVADVSESIDIWGNRLDQALWRSLRTSIEVRGIELQGFSSPATFYDALVAYVENGIQSSIEAGGSEADWEAYENFSAMWHNDFKNNWQEFLVDGGVMTFQNIATIDRKLTEWGLEAQPPGFNWLLIVALLGLLLLILVVIMVTRSKSPTEPAPL